MQFVAGAKRRKPRVSYRYLHVTLWGAPYIALSSSPNIPYVGRISMLNVSSRTLTL